MCPKCHKRKKCCKRDTYSITQSRVGTTGYVIDKPGRYLLCENIVFSPEELEVAQQARSIQPESSLRDVFEEYARTRTKEHPASWVEIGTEAWASTHPVARGISETPVSNLQAAITIQSDNVYLDLCNLSLSQGNEILDVVGIYICSGFKNIQIANGTVQNFGRSGVFSYVDTSSEVITPVRDLTLHKLNILENATNQSGDFTFSPGLGLTTPEFFIPFPTAKNYLNPENAAYANVLIDQCKVNRNRFGASIWYTSNLRVVDSEFNDQSVTGFTVLQAGFWVDTCLDVTLLNSKFNNTKAEFAVVISPMQIASTKNLIAENCQFNGANGTSFAFVGNLGTILSNALFTRCQFNDSKGISSGQIGFHLSDPADAETSGNGMRFVDCQFNNNILEVFEESVPGFALALGVDFLTIKGITFDHCQAIGNKIIPDVPGLFEGRALAAGGMSLLSVSPDPITAEINSGRSFSILNCTSDGHRGISECWGIRTGRTCTGNL